MQSNKEEIREVFQYGGIGLRNRPGVVGQRNFADLGAGAVEQVLALFRKRSAKLFSIGASG